MTTPIIFDTDPGIDDAQAIAIIMADPGIEVVGLTTTFGNVSIETATRNALSLVELAGQDIPVAQALEHIYGYAVGLDMTRRDLQGEMKKQGRPWCIGKGFDYSAPIGPITPVAQAGDVTTAGIWLQVNDADRQRSNVDQLIWNIAETVAILSQAWELQPGDLIMTGTPEGVGAVVRGDVMAGGVDGLESIRVRVA